AAPAAAIAKQKATRISSSGRDTSESLVGSTRGAERLRAAGLPIPHRVRNANTSVDARSAARRGSGGATSNAPERPSHPRDICQTSKHGGRQNTNRVSHLGGGLAFGGWAVRRWRQAPPPDW